MKTKTIRKSKPYLDNKMIQFAKTSHLPGNYRVELCYQYLKITQPLNKNAVKRFFKLKKYMRRTTCGSLV